MCPQQGAGESGQGDVPGPAGRAGEPRHRHPPQRPLRHGAGHSDQAACRGRPASPSRHRNKLSKR